MADSIRTLSGGCSTVSQHENVVFMLKFVGVLILFDKIDKSVMLFRRGK